MEGGFIGRKEDRKTIKKYITGNLYRIVTISGAGGVGKTALAHCVCDALLSLPPSRFPFDALVWISAKEEELSISGIDKLTPKLRTYEDMADEVLELFGLDTDKPITEKMRTFADVLEICSKGILFVIDNLETIEDEQLISFIKEMPPPHRVLITSRLGLGEIEKRYPLRSLHEGEAIALFRCVSRERQLHDLASNTDDVIRPLVKAMACYPLVIKWVLGQVSLGRALESTISLVTSAEGDVPKFCFNKIFESYLEPNDRLVLYALCTEERPMTKVVLCHISALAPATLDEVLQRLTVASLVINTNVPTERGELETRYELLSLTRQYLNAKLEQDNETHRALKSRAAIIQDMLKSARRARYSFRYSLKDFGAVTEQEQIASTWALTGHQRYVAGSYDESVRMFKNAVEFAPKFAPIYRLWASIESTERHFETASDLMKKATALAARDPGMWLARGQIEMKANNFPESVSHLEQALTLAPEDEIILGSLADAERRAGRFEEAEGHFMAALRVMKAKNTEARQLAITRTSRADSLRRWAEEIKDKDKNAASQKLELALRVINDAASLPNDAAALSTKRQIELSLGHVKFSTQGFLAAKPHYEAAICKYPASERDKRLNETAAFILADHCLRSGGREEAKRFIEICEQNGPDGSRFQSKLSDLILELNSGRMYGPIEFIAYNRGYGYVRVQGLSSNIKLEREALCNVCSLPDFNSLRGRTVSFVLFQSAHGEKLAKRVLVLK